MEKGASPTISGLRHHLREDRLQIRLLQSPALCSLPWSWADGMVREVPGVHHMKAFVFDNTCILTGANLERQYLDDRQDRYWVIEDQALADHLTYMIETIGSLSHELTLFGIRTPDILKNPKKY